MSNYKILAVDIGPADIDEIKDKLIGEMVSDGQYVGRHQKTNYHVFIVHEEDVPIFLGNSENLEGEDLSVDSISEIGSFSYNG